MECECVGRERVRPAPVRDPLGNELRGGDDDGDVLVGDECRCTCGNLPYLTDDARDLDALADLDGPLEQNDQTTEKVAGDRLQAEAQTDATPHHPEVPRT